MEITTFISLAVYLASAVICYVRSIFKKQVVVFALIIGGWLITYGIKSILVRYLTLDEVGIAVAFFVLAIDQFWILYVGPFVAITHAIVRKKETF